MMRAIRNNIYLFWLLLTVPAVFQIGKLVASGFDPAMAFSLEHGTGEMSVRLMILAMMISPLQALFGPKKWIMWLLLRRRYLGVAAAGYGLLHLLVYCIDLELFNGVWRYVLEDAAQFSIWTGYLALAIFIAMAVTSNNAAQRLMKHNWKRLQQLVYLAAILVAVHWIYVDGEWLGAIAHFAPLLLLQIIRIIRNLSK
jgi:sulfoxide reductase heme-binding subunit YedZ